MASQTYNLKEFKKEAEKFIRTLTPSPGHATVVGLYGDLGAGKTTFVQAAANALGVTETLNSPTFLILKSYKLPARTYRNPFGTGGKANSYKLLHHVDVYRLKNGNELRRLRFDELLADPQNLILVEWAERVADILPKDHLKLNFEFVDETTRRITM